MDFLRDLLAVVFVQCFPVRLLEHGDNRPVRFSLACRGRQQVYCRGRAEAVALVVE